MQGEHNTAPVSQACALLALHSDGGDVLTAPPSEKDNHPVSWPARTQAAPPRSSKGPNRKRHKTTAQIKCTNVHQS